MTEGANANQPLPVNADERLDALRAATGNPEHIGWELDADQRMIYAVIQRERTIADVVPPEPIRVGFPFHHAKTLVAQVLMHEGFELAAKAERMAPGPERGRALQQAEGKQAAAKNLGREAQIEEHAARAARMAADTRG